MKNIILPTTRVDEVYKVEPADGSILFDPMSIVGSSEKTSLRPNDWTVVNDITSPVVTCYSKGQGALFVDINRLINDTGLKVHKENLIAAALDDQLLVKTQYYEVQWKDGDYDYGSTYHREYNDALNAAGGTEERILTKDGLIGTQKLAEQLGISEQLLMTDATKYGIIGVLQQYSGKGLNIDGIYWSEEYQFIDNMAEILSIFPHKVESWQQFPATMPRNDSLLLTHKTPTSHQMLVLPIDRKITYEISAGPN